MSGGIIPALPLSAIHDEGMEARDEGVPATACPYPTTSDEWHEWLEGWHERDPLDEDDASEFQRFSPREA